MPYPASQIDFLRAGNGPPAIFVHGNPATHTLWRPLVERLAERRTIHAVDLPGFGGSPAPDVDAGYGRRTIAATLIAFADLHGMERFDLVGHSFGGAIAITLADMVPDRVSSLVAITPMTDRVPPLARLARSRVMRAFGGLVWRSAPGAARRWFASRWTRVSYGRGYSDERAEEVGREADRPELVRSLSGLIAEADYEAYGRTIEQIADCDVPLLLVGCGRDGIIPNEHFNRLSERLPRAERHIFPEGGHVPMWQYPDEMAALIARFWEERSVPRDPR